MANPYRIVLADDHALIRRGVKRVIQEIGDFEIVGEAADGLQLLEIVKDSPPDMVITDISMPLLRGLEATEEIKAAFPSIKVILLTMHRSQEYLCHALSAGAEGYLLKDDADDELLFAIKTIRKGGIYVSRLLAPELKAIFMDSQRLPKGQKNPPSEPLTTREREIVKLVAEGKSSKEIGAILYISHRTVHHHRENIKRKLNLKKSSDLVRYAFQKGYCQEDTFLLAGGNVGITMGVPC